MRQGLSAGGAGAHPAGGGDAIDIDGAVGEGGGQILRTSLALSLCTGRPVRLTRIRAGRPKPGLMRQHLTCVHAAAQVGGAQVQGADLGSTELCFTPGPVRAGDFHFPVGTAGSCTLVLQTVWPALLQAEAPSRLRLSGGTHNPMAPSFHFLARSYAPLMRRLGAPSELTLVRPGFHPAGGGEVLALLAPAAGGLQPFDLEVRGPLREAWADCLSPGLPAAVAQRELQALAVGLGWPADRLRRLPGRQEEGPGNALMATCVHEGLTEVFTALGAKGLPAEAVAQDLMRQLRDYQASDAPLGPHLADQWVLPLALAVCAQGRAARYRCTTLTLHATTHFALIERFLPVRVRATGQDPCWQVVVEPATAPRAPGEGMI
ncbi:RNA 3'-terminal phosphate cyclase [Ideonella livida]|uniref:RNA 3'-terminal phosphate cyclase n=1 Tax=Ideonella livida TaxID=2707176 RepID=A0A7C9PJM0_9BURK|nr:RNA 3'-terminal phosphate cyclase [Ideonella livida]NDY93553.1 RNA 3'-terminal phosphate cyclase [Ideonella livida]